VTNETPTVPAGRGHSTHRVGDRLPAVLVLSDLAPIFGLKVSQLGELERAGDLEPFELKPRVGKRARYSGKKLQAWLDGELEPAAAAAPLVLKGRRR